MKSRYVKPGKIGLWESRGYKVVKDYKARALYRKALDDGSLIYMVKPDEPKAKKAAKKITKPKAKKAEVK